MDSTASEVVPPVADPQPFLFAVGSLIDYLSTVPDPRSRKGRRYPLPILLLFMILAKLSGEDRPSGIADWVANRQEKLLAALHLSFPRMPNHNTYRRNTANLAEPEKLEKAFKDYMRSQPEVGTSALVVIDGKSIRGTVDLDNPRGDHLVAAYLPREGVVLFQVKAGSKENEISAAPKLLESIDLRGKVVVGDAIHTQRELSVQILKAGGDYLWLAKDNQPTLREDIALLFDGDDRTVEGGHTPNDFKTHQTIDKGHGRREKRRIVVSSELKGYSNWPGLQQVFKVERERTEVRTGEVKNQTVYGLTSLSREEAYPKALLSLTREYWGIENGLHHRRDVTFHEDATRQTVGHTGWVMASMNNLAISVLRRTGATNIAQARRKCDGDLTYTLSLVTGRLVT